MSHPPQSLNRGCNYFSSFFRYLQVFRTLRDLIILYFFGHSLGIFVLWYHLPTSKRNSRCLPRYWHRGYRTICWRFTAHQQTADISAFSRPRRSHTFSLFCFFMIISRYLFTCTFPLAFIFARVPPKVQTLEGYKKSQVRRGRKLH